MSANIVEINDTNFDQEVIQSDKPVVVDFWAPWCWPCRMLAPIFEQLADQYWDKVKFVKVNVDENPTSAIRFQVQGIPTVIFFKNGQIFWQPIVGVRQPQEYQALIEEMLRENNSNNISETKGNIVDIKWLQEFNEALENNKDKLIIADFWAPWCWPCRMLAPVLEQISKDFADKVLVLKVNVDDPQNQILAAQYQVTGIPHIELIKGGMSINKIVWAYPYEQFKKIVEQYL